MKYSVTLDVVVPAYNEARSVELFLTEFIRHFDSLVSYRIIFIDDGSEDTTWDQVSKLEATNEQVVGLRFNRNFGKEAALFAGLAYADADLVLTMDVDLQHPPSVAVEMLDKLIETQVEVVHAVKRNRNDRATLYTFAANSFNRLFKGATKLDMSNSTDFKLLKRSAVQSLLELNERETFYRGLVCWFGFRSQKVLFDVPNGTKSHSNWSITSLFKYGLNSMMLFSATPLKVVKYVGFVFFLFALIGTLHTLYNYFMGGSVEGVTTVVLLALFGNSLVLISLGIIGSYLARLYTEQKNRPRYHIDKVI